MRSALFLPLLLVVGTLELAAQDSDTNIIRDIDIFDLEWASDPQISPDGNQVVYVRNFMDIMTDRRRSNIWIVNTDGSGHRPITTGIENDSSPRWSPDGTRLAFASSSDGSRQLYLRWMDTGQTAKITNLSSSPGGLTWSSDGEWIAFSMFVPSKSKPIASMPAKPAGAEWAAPARVITDMTYRSDGSGFLPEGNRHIFVVSSEGGSARQLTDGDYSHGGALSWTPDGSQILFSANRREDADYQNRNSEIYSVRVADGSISQLTDRFGPDSGPSVSPDGQHVAYSGFDDQYQGYQVRDLYVMNIDGSNSRLVSGDLDRSIGGWYWLPDGNGFLISYTDEGKPNIATLSLRGVVNDLTDQVGGTALGRPYASGQYSLSASGSYSFTHGTATKPSDVAVGHIRGGDTRVLTSLNEDLLGYKKLGEVESIWYKSSYDGRDVQGWIMYPPDFDSSKKYPLVLEIHGGPFSAYGPEFASELQLYAAAGYVVLYTNPRGSTSYGGEFGNLIHHNYPGEDYDDLISGVDAVIDRGFIDEDNLFVTGGSGGGVLSAWIVGKTDRFKAAVVQKPVINWIGFALTSDGTATYYKYWFPGVPWENVDHYWKRSPLSLVGNVETPTMLLTGESDLRTPIAESEQFYQALKIRKIDTALVRIPNASHGIAVRPSNLISKVNHILAWFEKYRIDSDGE